VAEAIRYGRERDLEIGVRCGGHSVLGLCVPDDGLMIDLRPMGGVRIDPERRRAWVQGGALLGALGRMSAARRYGAALEPFASGMYVNAMSDEGASGVARAYPPAKLARLSRLKAAYDPDHVFRLNPRTSGRERDDERWLALAAVARRTIDAGHVEPPDRALGCGAPGAISALGAPPPRPPCLASPPAGAVGRISDPNPYTDDPGPRTASRPWSRRPAAFPPTLIGRSAGQEQQEIASSPFRRRLLRGRRLLRHRLLLGDHRCNRDESSGNVHAGKVPRRPEAHMTPPV
jgi:hypothetical protein